MELQLILTLINRLINKDPSGPFNPFQNEFYNLLSETEPPFADQLDRVEWIHQTMLKPTQADLDAEKILYDEELLAIEIMPFASQLAMRINPDLQYGICWYIGKYEDAQWYDEILNSSLALQRATIQVRIDQNIESKTFYETQLGELQMEQATLELIEQPTVPEIERLQDLINYKIPENEAVIINIDEQILKDTTLLADVPADALVLVKPTYQEIKDEYQVYLNELAAIKAQRELEEAEYAEMNIDQVLISLLGDQCHFVKKKNKHWDDVQIRSGEIKPTWDEMKIAWANLKPIQQNYDRRQQKKKQGFSIRLSCNSIFDLINGSHANKGLTEADIDNFETTYNNFIIALQNIRPDKAKKILNKITPDGTLMTQEDKDDYLVELTELGF